MGYISKQIIEKPVTEPVRISLSGLPNFLELKGMKAAKESIGTEIHLRIKDTKFANPANDENSDQYIVPQTRFTVTELYNTGMQHSFGGTYDRERVNDKTFLLVNDAADKNKTDAAAVAENIRWCLSRNPFFRGKFDITIPFVRQGDKMVNGDTIVISSLGTGLLYKFTFDREDQETGKKASTLDALFAEIVKGKPEEGYNNDLVDEGMGNVDIEADLYTDTGIFFGENDMPEAEKPFGRHIATMSKAYFGQPFWFDVNALMNANKTYSDDFLRNRDNTRDQVWTDAGTVNDLRLIVKKNDGVSCETFYCSNVLYAVTGYARTLDRVDLENEYVFEYPHRAGKLIKPLTNQPVLPHVKGQTQYFNFLFKDPTHSNKENDNDYRLGIRYDLYSQSGKFISTLCPENTFRAKGKCFAVNNIRLDIDGIVEQAEADQGLKVGRVEVSLCCDKQVVSHPSEYRILPHCLYRVNDFAFLNSLGGWSSFNFGGEKTVNVKSSANTFYANQLPRYDASSRIESVFDKELKETYTVKTLPVKAEIAEWLREAASSVAVYELATKRYIVVEDFDIKHNNTNDLFVLEMKYRYSDTYNAVIK